MKNLRLMYIFLVSLLFLGGCAFPQNQGKMIRAGEVDKLVESATVLDGHTYYYTGPEAEPDAIIAIESRLTLKSKYWVKVEKAVEQQLTDWNRFIDNGNRLRNFYEGRRIMTPEGQQVGIWYSKYHYTVIQFPDPSSIIIYAPLVPFERREQRFRNI